MNRDEIREELLKDIPPKEQVEITAKEENPPLVGGLYYKCPRCKTCNVRKKEGQPERKCEGCAKIPDLTDVEKEYMEEKYKVIQEYTDRYDQKVLNPSADWNRVEDPDFRGRMNSIDELHKFAREKGIWIWDRIRMY